MPGITVGMDGSSHSHRALEWAVKEAAIRQAPLTVLTVVPVATNIWTGNPMTNLASEPEIEAVRQQAEETVQKTISELSGPAPTAVTVHVRPGLPASELVDASRDADLLIVGSRGAGGFASLLLGSVSSQVVHHAACPVVVVPHDR